MVAPVVPGHETAGTIAEVGEGVTGWKVGDRVAVWPMTGQSYTNNGAWESEDHGVNRHPRRHPRRRLLRAGRRRDRRGNDLGRCHHGHRRGQGRDEGRRDRLWRADAIETARSGGRVVQVGMGRLKSTINTYALILGKVQLHGSAGGSKDDIAETMRRIASGDLDPLLTMIGFEQIAEGIGMLDRGEARGRLVAKVAY